MMTKPENYGISLTLELFELLTITTYRTPYNTVEQLSNSLAIGLKLRYNYLKYTCWAARIKNPDSCPVAPDDIANCAKKSGYLMDLIKNSDSLTEEELNEIPISVSDIPDIVTELSKKALEPIEKIQSRCSTDDADWDTDTLD
jgi:hypothetical protein